jgi:predicted hotdog family 3-hydroxylacyl-ACP dehydratase
MTAADDIRSLIPHGGSMCLLERIVAWNERSVSLATSTHASTGNPLRRDGRLHAIHLCEYGAQAMAAHGGLLARGTGRGATSGMLVSLRDVVLSADFVESLPGELVIEAEILQVTAGSRQYAFRVTHGATELIRGRAAVIEGTVPL